MIDWSQMAKHHFDSYLRIQMPRASCRSAISISNKSTTFISPAREHRSFWAKYSLRYGLEASISCRKVFIQIKYIFILSLFLSPFLFIYLSIHGLYQILAFIHPKSNYLQGIEVYGIYQCWWKGFLGLECNRFLGASKIHAHYACEILALMTFFWAITFLGSPNDPCKQIHAFRHLQSAFFLFLILSNNVIWLLLL